MEAWEINGTDDKKETARRIRECKVIFLGGGAVGKTSLIERIVNDRFQDGGASTDGVRMTNWPTVHEGVPFTLRFLDFGGQEIMHAMHRCFLTPHTVYVVVCDVRNDDYIESVAARWLETVRSFAPDCPVILALNKADLNPGADVNRADLQKRNPSLRRILHTSAKAARNDEYGAERLLREIWKAAQDCADFPEASESWLGIKRELENMTEPYVTAERYRNLCERYGVVSPSVQLEALQCFQDLGVIYFYSSNAFNPALENIRVLNPEWLTNGIYRLILRTPPAGFLSHRIIRETLETSYPGDISDKTYSAEETEFILQVMRKFGISLPMGDGVEMIPMKMRKTPSQAADNFPRTSALHLRWKIKYPPNNLIHRLVIRKASELDLDAVWRTGGRFRQATTGCAALAEMNDEGLDVYVTGEPMERRQYMESFRSVIQDLMKTLNLQGEEYIIVEIDGKEGQVAYRDVMEQYYRNPEMRIYIPGAKEYVSPLELLQETYYNVEEKAYHFAEAKALLRKDGWREVETPKSRALDRLERVAEFSDMIKRYSFLALAGLLFIGLLFTLTSGIADLMKWLFASF